MTPLKILSDLRSVLRWPIFLIYSFALYFFFSLPLQKIPPAVMQANDKLLHLLVFLLLALLAFQAFFYSRFSIFRTAARAKSTLFSIFYGAFLEGVQIHAPGRTASFSDWAFDIAGVMIAACIFWISRSGCISPLSFPRKPVCP